MQLSADGVDALRARAQQDVDEGAVPSCQFALALDGEVLLQETLGDAPMVARYSIWSSTKPVFSSGQWAVVRLPDERADQDILRQARRGRELSQAAVACVV